MWRDSSSAVTRAERNAAAIRSGGGHAAFVRTDVRQEPDVLRLMNEAVSAFRAIHVLINNAGVSRFKPLYDLSAGRVGKVEDIVRACFYLTDPSNDFVTGIHLVVDGGMTRKMIYEPET